MTMRPFLFAMCLSSVASAQMVCGPSGCYDMNSTSSMGWYSQPTVMSTSPSYITSSTPRTVQYTEEYRVGDDGSVLTPSGHRVTKVGGVEIVAKSWAMQQKAKPRIGEVNPDIAIIKAQLDRIEDKLDRNPVFGKQSKEIPKAELALARLEAIQLSMK